MLADRDAPTGTLLGFFWEGTRPLTMSNSTGILRGGMLLCFARLVAVASLAMVAGCSLLRAGNEQSLERYARPERLVELPDGRKINFRCEGAGGPPVILEAGLGFPSLSWRLVQGRLSSHRLTCSYDRAGIGFSDPAGTRRSPQASSHDLALALDAAAMPGPFILVGSSYGGLVVQEFARQFPDRVAGLLLLDPAEAGQDLALQQVIPEYADEVRRSELADAACLARALAGGQSYDDMIMLGCATSIDARFPRALRKTLMTQRIKASYLQTVSDENASLRELARDGSPPSPLPSGLPLIVVTAGRAFETPEAQRIWRDLHLRTANLSTRGEERVAPSSGHVIQIGDPDLVVALVAELTARAGQMANTDR